MKLLKALGYFWYDFVIGDDWKIAAYVLLALAVVAALAVNGIIGDSAIGILGAVLLAVFFILGVHYDARKPSK